jgi:hypothetical protein
MNEAQVEHDSAKALIDELKHMTAKNEMFNAKFKVLAEYVNHHITEEQNAIFPKARMAKLDLAALGQRMLDRKQALAAGEQRPARRRPTAKKRVAPQRSAAHRKPQRKTTSRRHAA